MEAILAPRVVVRHYSHKKCHSIFADHHQLDYSEQTLGVKFDLTAKEFLQLSDNKNRLGGLVDCIHHVGASKFERTGKDTITGHHQIRVEYKRYRTMEKKETEVEARGHGLTMMLHYYKKVDGKWKLAGVKPQKRLDEFNFPQIFKEPEAKGKAKM